MSDKPHKHEKGLGWKRFKGEMKKSGKWIVNNLLPVAVSVATGGIGLSVAISGLASEFFKKISDASLDITISEEIIKEKLEELFKGEGRPIEYLQEKLAKANSWLSPRDIKLVIGHVIAPVLAELSTMLEIMREERPDLQEILAGWLEEQSKMIQNEFSLTHEQISAIQNEMLNGFKRTNINQAQILENIKNIQQILKFELVGFKQELSEQIQAVFGQSSHEYDLDAMFNLATGHFNHQNFASWFDQSYNPDLYVRPELFFESMSKFLTDFKDPMQNNVPIFLLLGHLGTGKSWNLAYTAERLLIERNVAIPFFINLRNGLQHQLYGIFKTQNMHEIVDRCQKIKAECQLPIFLILDGLDELMAGDWKNVFIMLKELFIKRTDALCVALSCRTIAWVEVQRFFNEQDFFEDHIWSTKQSSDWKAQFDIATPISCVLGEFSDIELDVVIDRYGLERDKFSAGLYNICHQPYILRLVSEFIDLHNKYPNPEDPQSMASLFYSNDQDNIKNTILYWMGVHGIILDLFFRIIEAFPSADSELSDKEFKEFANDPNFRPILYSGIILRLWRQMKSFYQINSVYVPLLSQLFPHLSKPKKDENESKKQRKTAKLIPIPPPDQLGQLEPIKKLEYFFKVANKRRDQKKFDAEFEALKKAEKIVAEAKDNDLTNMFEKRMAEFEKENKVRQDAEQRARREEERKAREEAEQRAKEEAERKAKEDDEKKGIVEFRGVKIFKKEKDVLELFEKEGGEIPVLEKTKWDVLGVVIEDMHVVSLNLLLNEKLTTIPESIRNLTELTYLNVGYNKINAIPESIGELTKLSTLSLSSNNIKEIPESIGKLTELEELYLGENQIPSFPEIVTQMTNLVKLGLEGNGIKEIPESIGKLTNLIHLWLEGNKISELPESIGELTSLKKLDLSKNSLQSLPESIKNLEDLEELDVAENQLTKLPESFGQLGSLNTLVLTNNKLKSLPESFGQLDSLIYLDLQNNELTELPKSFGDLFLLTSLDLRHNPLKTLPENIGSSMFFQDITLSTSQLQGFPESVKKRLKELKNKGVSVLDYW